MRIGGLFEGYGGLTMATQAVLGGDLAWYSEIDKGALKVLRHHHPDVPNLGDITAVDWSQVEPVDVLTGGFPCQDVSVAGKRAGMRPDTRSGLWSQFAYAIDQLRPSLVIIENVRGLFSAEAHSDLEPCPWCLGEDAERPLRALGAVLGSLAELGFDAEWVGLPASNVGAPHGRFRVFIAAWPAADAPRQRWAGRDKPWPDVEHDGPQPAHPGPSGRTLLPTPTTQDAANNAGPSQFGRNSLPLNTAVTLLPTPAVNDMGEGKTPAAWDAWTARMKAEHGNGNGHGPSLAIETMRLREEERSTRWGSYGEAIHRWESLTRRAPDATETGPKGSPRLSAAFSEWMMGLPAGHVTGTPGITRNEALKLCGNGVVPQQGAAGIALLLERAFGEAEA